MSDRHAAWVAGLNEINTQLALMALLGVGVVIVLEGVKLWPWAGTALAKVRGGLFAIAYAAYVALLAAQFLALVAAGAAGR